MAITESEFAEKVKTKYPQYKDIDDSELVFKVLDKYPEYKTQLGEKEYSKNLITNSAKSVVSGGVQAAINAGAGVAQSYSMLLGDKSDTSEEAIKEYASQRRVQPRKGGSRMTEGKILAHRERKNEVLQSLNENAHRLRKLANGIDEQFNIDPEFANKRIGQVFKGIGQVIGNIGAVAVGTIVGGPKGGIAAATGAIAPQMVSEAVNDAESTLGKSYMDMTEEEKEEVALATAAYTVVGTAFEFAPVARIPWVKNFLKGKTKVPAGLLKSPRIRREIAKGFAAEGFTEAAQGQLLDSLARATFDDDRELMSWDVLRQRFNEFFVGGIVGGTVSGGIATVQRTARGELFKPKETKEVQADGTTKEVFEITYTDRNTNEPVTIEIDADNQEDAARIAGERLVTSAVEGTIVARPKPAPEPVTQPEPGVTVEDEPTAVVAEEVVTEEVIPEAEQADLQEELQQEVDQQSLSNMGSINRPPVPEPTFDRVIPGSRFTDEVKQPEQLNIDYDAIAEGTSTLGEQIKQGNIQLPSIPAPDVTAGAAPVGTPQTFQQPLPTGELPTSINDKESNDILLDSRPTYDRVQAVKSTVTKAGKKAKGYFEKLGDLVSTYDFFPEGSKRANTKAKVDEFVDFVERNVLYLYDTMDAKIRERTKLWYDGANHIAQGFANRYGISQDEAAGVLAVLSPQKDWFQNVSLAERVLDAWYNRDSIPAWGSEMDATAARIWKAKDKLLIDAIRGKKLNELSDPMKQAAWTRTYDETFNSREFAIITPEGGILPPARNKIGWGSTDEIAKTFKILNNPGNAQALSKALGKMHKVRSFYNNIAYPNSANGYATMDTHAIAAGMFFPVGGGNPITKAGLGGSPTRGPDGLYGTYPLYLEAYTRAAKKRGVLPREMQSITWEQIRTLFTNKSKPKLDFASKTWKSYSKGDITYEEAIEKIITNHEGFGEPAWVESSAGLDVFLGNPTYKGPLSRTGIPGPELQVGTAGSGRDSRVAGDVQAGPEVTAQAAPIDGPGQPTPSQAEASRIQKRIEDTFGEIAAKIGTSINVNTGVETAGRYNASTGVIEINPEKIVELYAAGQVDIVNDAYVRFLMREEIVHGTVEKVLIQRGIKNTRAWYEQLGRDLTQAQRNEVNDIYNVEQNYEGVVDYGYGTEFARMIIQRGLYGNITEAFITSNKGKAYDKMVRVLKSVQAYITKALKGEVTTNPEAAGVIVEAARLLQSVDPDAKLVEQKVVDKSMAYSEDVNPNGEVTSQQVAQLGKPPSEKKLNINFARKYLLTVSSLLNSIHPRLKALIRNYYGTIQREVLDYQKRVAPFFKKYRGIRNTKDRRRLKTLLLYSPVEQEGVDPLIEERDALLRKYDLFNDYQLEIRPVLNELYSRMNNEGIIVGFLEEYFPRSINDLDKVKNRAGKELRDAFRDFVNDRNDKIEEARKNIDEGKPQRGDAELAKERTVQIGDPQTAALEAQQWDQFTRGFNLEGRRNLPGNFLSRTEELNVIPDELLDAYDDPGVSMERYIYNTVTAIQTTRLMGSKFANVPQGLKVPPASELGLLIQELKANGEISVEDADTTVPDIFAFILSPMQMENIYFQLARTFGYGTLLVEFTSTLSQLYDLPFIMLDNGIFGTAVAMFGPRLKGEDFGIDVNQVSAEFAGDNRVLEKAVRLGLRATGFTKLDQVMKETNMTANYNRYRKLARGYYKDRNSSNSKKFIAELTSMGYSAQEQTKLIADLKSGNRDSAYIRTLLFNKLSETQPLTQAEMAMGIVGNPNLRFTVAMKSFMIKQLNFVRDRMVLEFIDGVRTGNARKIKKASTDMALLMTFMLMIGLPVDALKDFLAGRLGYMSDYLFNGVFRIFGVSRYTAYQFRKEGAGEALRDYFTPVAFQQFYDLTGELGRVASGQRALTESKFVQILPFSDVINRIFGFQKERERREFKRRIREGERPFLVPLGAI